MKKYRLKYMYRTTTFVLVASILSLVACTGNFEKLNTHPTDIYEEDLSTIEKVGSLFPTMTYLLNPSQENQNQLIEQMIGGAYGGYFTTTNNWEGAIPNLFNPADKYSDYPYEKMFTEFYPNFLKIAEITKKQGYIYAWANIIRVGVMLRVADIYGPIPYSQMGSGQFAVAYDDSQTLYHHMIEDLTQSIHTLSLFMKENVGKDLPIAQYDRMYNGKFEKWILFANSLKLRMAVRIAAVDTEFAKQIMKEAIEGGVIELNGDNAFLPSNDNPYYKASSKWKDLAINATLSAYMSSYDDPRISHYMTESSYEKNGNKYFGVRMGIDYNATELPFYKSQFSKPAYTQSSSLPVYHAAETYFLKAEAALQGWIDGGESMAKAYYEKGIQTSMEEYEVTIANYLTNTKVPEKYEDPYKSIYNATFSNAPSVSWEDGSNKLEKIITQKWIANYPIGLESWADFRRTGYPQIITAYKNGSSDTFIGSIDSKRMVRRLPYPNKELDNNSANVKDAITNMLKGEDKGSTDLWWAKKN